MYVYKKYIHNFMIIPVLPWTGPEAQLPAPDPPQSTRATARSNPGAQSAESCPTVRSSASATENQWQP